MPVLFNSVEVKNFRSIEDSGSISLGSVTLIIGRNNVGKSSLLRGIYSMQDGSGSQASDIRIGESESVVALGFSLEIPACLHLYPGVQKLAAEESGPGALTCTRQRSGAISIGVSRGRQLIGINNIPSREPSNLIFPALAGRRVTLYREQASERSAFEVGPTDNNLISKIMNLSASGILEGRRFRELCQKVLGIDINILPGENGQQILGVSIDRFNYIPLEAMGAGLSGVLGLLVGLSVAEGKLFIIEEPEDGLHPAALKELVDAIAKSSEKNQFIISTHSSIVLTRLSDLPGLKVIHATSDNERMPSSTFTEVVGDNDRIKVLQDLGYGLADLDLGEGWLIFEEASAERLIRQYLVPWFAPGLTRLRTLGARGVSRVGPLFDDYREMVLFSHLEPFYRNRAWVIVDGDKAGRNVVENLRRNFANWPQEHFRCWSREAFELYYPSRFSNRVQEVLAIQDNVDRRQQKKDLLDEILDWIEEDKQGALDAFAVSAADVITVLQEIEAELLDLTKT